MPTTSNEVVESKLDKTVVYIDLGAQGGNMVAIRDDYYNDVVILHNEAAERLLTQLLARKERISNERQNQG